MKADEKDDLMVVRKAGHLVATKVFLEVSLLAVLKVVSLVGWTASQLDLNWVEQ